MTAFFLKFTKETRVIEPLVIYVMSYLAFLLAETVHWSGIISLVRFLSLDVIGDCAILVKF